MVAAVPELLEQFHAVSVDAFGQARVGVVEPAIVDIQRAWTGRMNAHDFDHRQANAAARAGFVISDQGVADRAAADARRMRTAHHPVAKLYAAHLQRRHDVGQCHGVLPIR